ncbi:tetratricopeptide repeat protein [Bradyrhizobium sp.]|uniref:tetratricopeptide repeat-containing glycosyltransferase family protein n=1 Tax=Bradyrhizobium sp. TaxID=376 RepID=UPI003C440F9F
MNRRERRAAEKANTGTARIEAGGKRVPGAHGLAVLQASAIEQALAGRLLDAQARCRQALALDPDNADTLHIVGLVHLEAGQFDHAVEWVSRAIRKSLKPAYLTTLGIALRKLGRHDDALRAFDQAMQLKPDDAGLSCQLSWQMGNTLLAAGRPSDALLCFKLTAKLDPRHREAAYMAGYLLHEAGQLAEALVDLERSAELQPDHAPTRYLRALVLKSLNRFDEAIAENLRAIALDPANAKTCNNMGAVLQAQNRTEEALSWYQRSLAIDPDAATTLVNKASALAELCRLDEAMMAYGEVLAIDAGHAEAAWNVALLQLLRGDFKAGWTGREVRWRIPTLSMGYPKLRGAMWFGREPVAGRTVVVCSDEGFGDSIQFARYVPMLAARGARVILMVEPALCPILSGLNGVSQCLPRLPDTVLPPFDFHVPISSLPLAFETRLDTIPAATSYLAAPDAERAQAWDNRLGRRHKMRVGLVWSGDPRHWNDRNRSMPFRMLSRILDVDATFVSLQKEPRPRDAELLRATPDIVDFTADLTDFAETAALLSCLDLVITVDTSIAHLAGALGRPTWVLLPHVPDWRWLLDRDDSPWYPTLRLFRQTAARDYGPVLDQVRAELVASIDAKKGAPRFANETPDMPAD